MSHQAKQKAVRRGTADCLWGGSVSGRLVLEDADLVQVPVGAPMRLYQHLVDLLDVDGLGLVPDGLNEARQGDVPGFADKALGGACHKRKGVFGEGVVPKARLVELRKNPGLHIVGDDLGHDNGIRDAGLDVFMGREADGGEQRRLSNENQVVVLGEVLCDQVKLACSVGDRPTGIIAKVP